MEKEQKKIELPLKSLHWTLIPWEPKYLVRSNWEIVDILQYGGVGWIFSLMPAENFTYKMCVQVKFWACTHIPGRLKAETPKFGDVRVGKSEKSGRTEIGVNQTWDCLQLTFFGDIDCLIISCSKIFIKLCGFLLWTLIEHFLIRDLMLCCFKLGSFAILGFVSMKLSSLRAANYF